MSANIPKYKLPLGQCINEDMGISLNITYDPTLYSYQFYLVKDNIAPIPMGTITSSNIPIIINGITFSNSLTLIVHATEIALLQTSDNYNYFIQQTDTFGFKSNVYQGQYYLLSPGKEFNTLNVQNAIAVIATILGNTGPTGPQGNQGSPVSSTMVATGPQGNQGKIGPQGTIGPQGN